MAGRAGWTDRRTLSAALLCAAASQINGPALHDVLLGLVEQDVPGFVDRYASTDFRPAPFPSTPAWTGPVLMTSGPMGHILVQAPDLPQARLYVLNVQQMETGRVVRSVFLRAGQDQDVRIPVGSYALSVMSGTRWFGPRDMFGMGTRAERVLIPFQIEGTADGEANGFTVDLTPEVGGNMPMHRVTALGG